MSGPEGEGGGLRVEAVLRRSLDQRHLEGGPAEGRVCSPQQGSFLCKLNFVEKKMIAFCNLNTLKMNKALNNLVNSKVNPEVLTCPNKILSALLFV